MRFLPGALGFGQLQRRRVSATNPGAVTILSTPTTLVSVDCQTVAENDLVFVSLQADITPGVSTNILEVLVEKESGTAAVLFSEAAAITRRDFLTNPAIVPHSVTETRIGRVSTAGTLVLRVRGTSIGSDSTVGVGLAVVAVFVIRGSN